MKKLWKRWMTVEDPYDIVWWRRPEWCVRGLLYEIAVFMQYNWTPLLMMIVVSTIVSVTTVLVMR